MSLKAIIDKHFPKYFEIENYEDIPAEETMEKLFDLKDTATNYVVPHKEGQASFGNCQKFSFEVLAYDKMMQRHNNRKCFLGRKTCDFILFDERQKIVVFNEITSSKKGMSNLAEPLPSKTYSKFEKVEKQLADSVAVLSEIQEVKQLFDACGKKVCLCSYELYSGENKTRMAFGRANAIIDRETGERGAELSSNEIEAMGFKYVRISHNYTYKLS